MSGISVAKRFRILSRDQFTCQYCGRKPPEVVLELDHVHPRSLGGPDSEVNLVTACEDCNGGKAAICLRGTSYDEVNTNALYETLDADTLSTTGCSFAGLYFHARQHRNLQGQVVRELDAGRVLVQPYSWADGEARETLIFGVATIVSENWLFFTSHAQFRKITDAWCEEKLRAEDHARQKRVGG